jgi:hypothetical protein
MYSGLLARRALPFLRSARLRQRQWLSVAEAEVIFEGMTRYPDYQVYAALTSGKAVGTLALLVIDNFGTFGSVTATASESAPDIYKASYSEGVKALLSGKSLCFFRNVRPWTSLGKLQVTPLIKSMKNPVREHGVLLWKKPFIFGG